MLTLAKLVQAEANGKTCLDIGEAKPNLSNALSWGSALPRLIAFLSSKKKQLKTENFAEK